MNVKIILQYDGSRFDGWQKQGNTENTIQGRLEAVLEKMCGYPVEVHGSGRTDRGVHALGQTANLANRNKWLKPHIPSNNLYDVLRLKTVEECHANLPSKMILARYFYAITKMCVSSITG